MSKYSSIEEIYFYPHTLVGFINVSEERTVIFLFEFKLDNIFYRIKQIFIYCCLNCHEIVAKNTNHNRNVLQDIFQKKRSMISLKKSSSVKNLTLSGKISVGYCLEHETIKVFFHWRIQGKSTYIEWKRNKMVEKFSKICRNFLLKSCDMNLY